MKDISQLTAFIDKITKETIPNIVKANENTAKTIWEDIVNKAPINTGNYVSSIKIYPTEMKDNKISTFIGSDMKVKTKDGKSYLLGELLEYGTNPHAIPNAFNWGEIYGYDSKMYERTLDPNWHPGTISQPHFKPSLQKNEETYLENISKAIKEAEK